MSTPTRRLLAVASAGGHWTQLRMLDEAITHSDIELLYLTTHLNPIEPGGSDRIRFVRNADKTQPFRVLLLIVEILRVVTEFKPDVIISTGAAPGAIAVIIGKCFGARTIWLDSVANFDKLSLSARIARPFIDCKLTQWSHLHGGWGFSFKGSLL